MFARVTFLPSLAWNLLRNRASGWNWFDRIDGAIILGALPFRGPITQKILLEENVHSVVSMNEDFELRAFVTTPTEWKRLNIDFLQLPTRDILHSPSLERLEEGVNFLMAAADRAACLPVSMAYQHTGGHQFPLSIKQQGQYLPPGQATKLVANIFPSHPSVYVHCKAGRTRSATLVACYLIERYSLRPEEAVAEIVSKRPQVLLHAKQWNALEQFYERRKKSPSSIPNSLFTKNASIG